MKARELAQGKWPSVLEKLGVPAESLTGKHGPCPRDGKGTDRFRFADRDGSGSYFCACSEGDRGGMSLLMCCRGWDYATAAKEVEAIVGTAEARPTQTHGSRDPVKVLKGIQERLQSPGDAVRTYLANRGLSVPSSLRQARMPFWKDGHKVGEFDAMIARVVSSDGKPLTFHVTYLQNGKKAPVVPPRKLMTPVAPINGGAIRLMPPEEDLGVAEGIESALSASAIYKVPVWACISEALLAAFEPPSSVKRLWIFADNDKNHVGQHAAYALARRLSKSGQECEVFVPRHAGQDFNDVLLERRQDIAA